MNKSIHQIFRLCVSDTQFSRDMDELIEALDELRTITFPRTVRTVRKYAFYWIDGLRSAVLNEGIEVLGEDSYYSDGDAYPGVFENSGLRRIKLPTTLRRLEYSVFKDCKSLRNV